MIMIAIMIVIMIMIMTMIMPMNMNMIMIMTMIKIMIMIAITAAWRMGCRFLLTAMYPGIISGHSVIVYIHKPNSLTSDLY